MVSFTLSDGHKIPDGESENSYFISIVVQEIEVEIEVEDVVVAETPEEVVSEVIEEPTVA